MEWSNKLHTCNRCAHIQMYRICRCTVCTLDELFQAPDRRCALCSEYENTCTSKGSAIYQTTFAKLPTSESLMHLCCLLPATLQTQDGYDIP